MATSPKTNPAAAPVGEGTRERPWVLETPSRQGEFTAWRDEAADPPALVVQVGKTELLYRLRCLDDLAAMLKTHVDWMPLGSTDEQKPAVAGTVEAWALLRQSRRGLVRHEKGPSRPFRQLCAASHGIVGPRGGRAQSEEQPHAGELAR